jgi:hypothetical protein
MLFTTAPTALEEITRVLKITDGVMRHLAVRRVKGGSIKAPAPIAALATPAEAAPSAPEAVAVAEPVEPSEPVSEVEAVSEPADDTDAAE